MSILPKSMRVITLIVGLMIFGSSTTAAAQVTNIDKTPSWYEGSKPWLSISKEGRRELIQMRAAYEATLAKAKTPAKAGNSTGAVAGKKLIAATVTKYGLDPWHLTPDYFGPRMVVWLPETAWNKFNSAQRASIEAYMKSKYANWGIGVGRVRGKEVLLDRLVIER